MNLFESTFEKHKHLMMEKRLRLNRGERTTIVNNIKSQIKYLKKKSASFPTNTTLSPEQKAEKAKIDSDLTKYNTALAKYQKTAGEELDANLPKLTPTDYSRISTDFSKLMAGDLSGFVDGLKKSISDPKVQKFLLMAKEDGKLDDDKIFIEQQDVVVANLEPTQNEVFLEKSLQYPFENKPENISNFINGDTKDMPRIVVSGKYIIDGHHRWGQIYCLNKKGTIATYNITFEGKSDPDTLLKKMHLGIAATTGNVPLTGGESEDTNLFTVTREKFGQWILDKLTEFSNALQSFKEVGDIMRKEIKEIPEEKPPIDSSKDSKNEIANENEDTLFIKNVIIPYLWLNVESLRKNRGKHARAIMPQTEKDTPIDSFIKVMGSQRVNVDVQSESLFESTFKKFRDLYTR